MIIIHRLNNYKTELMNERKTSMIIFITNDEISDESLTVNNIIKIKKSKVPNDMYSLIAAHYYNDVEPLNGSFNCSDFKTEPKSN